MEAYRQQIEDMPAHLLPFVPYIEKNISAEPRHILQADPTVIQLQTVQNWLRTCSKLHGYACRDDKHSHPNRWYHPIWLISVNEGRLAPAPVGARYVALSYVWGENAASSCTTRDNLHQFRKPNGLCEDPNTLPRTIRDAIDLVRHVGEAYLWVDRFCIIQDDELTKGPLLNGMGGVYAGAVFTIVAAQNLDSTEGLYGQRPLCFGTALEPPRTTGVGNSREILLGHAMELMRYKWYSRGWTLQEYLFSRRRLVFHNNTVNWECVCASWHETQDLSTCVPQNRVRLALRVPLSFGDSPVAGFDVSPWPDMFRYGRLVSLYNRRALTFPEDILDAFAGILSHLSRSFPGGFICGLPLMCFDATLLWQPWTYMPRRNAAKQPARAASASAIILPSWSWVGWSGNMNSESWRSAANYLLESDDQVNSGQQCSWKTISTVKWFYSHFSGMRDKEINNPPEFSNPRFDPGPQALPEGWSAKKDLNTSQRFLYYHICDPEHPFRYPILIRDKHKAHVPPISACYLHCTTNRGFLHLGQIYGSTASNCPAVDLLTPDGAWAGALRLNCFPSVAEGLVNDAKSGCMGVELIEISAGSVENQPIEEKSFDEWNRPGCPRHGGAYEFVNVLWIEWADGTAYRKALGRVMLKAWRNLALEQVNIQLG